MEEEDLGGRAPLEEAGPPSKPPTPGTFPRRRPPYAPHFPIRYAKTGACAGEFLLGLGGQLAISNWQFAMNGSQAGALHTTPYYQKPGSKRGCLAFFVRQIAFPGDLPLSFCFPPPKGEFPGRRPPGGVLPCAIVLQAGAGRGSSRRREAWRGLPLRKRRPLQGLHLWQSSKAAPSKVFPTRKPTAASGRGRRRARETGRPYRERSGRRARGVGGG